MTPTQKVDELLHRLLGLVKDTARLADATDIESIADIYYRISVSHIDTPNLRLTWLANLALHHSEAKRWDEAAQAHLFAAHLIAQYQVTILFYTPTY
jgi:hypothetical protein